MIGAGAVGLSAVAALADRGAAPIIVSDYKAERRRIAESSFGAHVLVDPAERDVFDVFREVRAERGMPGPAVVFECVGASGLMQKIVNDSEFYTRIFCAGGWYSGDSLVSPMRRVRESQFSSAAARHPQDWYGVLEAVASGRLDPLPSVGSVIGLDEVPEALDLARRSEGPPRIIVHPNGNAE